MFGHGSPALCGGTAGNPCTKYFEPCEDGHIAPTRSVLAIQSREEAAAVRQNLSIVLVVIASLLVVGAKVVAPKPGLTRSYFTGVKTAVPSGMKSFPNELLPQ
jgi:hypothetical protein